MLRDSVRLLLLLLITGLGCRPATEVPVDLGDGGLISGQPCSAPCFFGVIPGETTGQAAKLLLKEHNIYYGCKLAIPGIHCPGYNVGVNDSTSLVYVVVFAPSTDLRISDVIESLGPPDSWIVVEMDYGVFPQNLQLILHYNSIRTEVSLEYQTREDQQYELSPDSRVNSILYQDEQRFLVYERDWKGYGLYESW